MGGLRYGSPEMKSVWVGCFGLWLGVGASAVGQAALPGREWPVQGFADVLDLHQEPQSATDRSHEMFFDEGAWHGYALPPRGDQGTGFVGPFLSATGAGIWAGRRFGTVELSDSRTRKPVALTACDGGGVSLPGALARRACGSGVTVSETLFYASASTALVRVMVRAAEPVALTLKLGGEQTVEALAGGDRLETSVPGSNAGMVRSEGGRYGFAVPQTVELKAGASQTFYLQQTYLPASQGARLEPWPGSPEAAWREAGARWTGYLKRGGTLRAGLRGDDAAERINVRAMETLLSNWRAALGDVHHAGVIPSYSNPDFHAFWAWDSWKHAAALAWFAPELAKEQIRAMFEFQLADGMVPDLVARDHREDNLRDSKPPLAAWAVMAVYRQTRDKAFVAEMFDKLCRYHRWWYADRDHAQDGLAEYGSTDGTREAAGWESGMDNAVRFDDAKMVENHAGAWSFDQESVDLNSYLYQEKLELAEMADVLGKQELAGTLRREAAVLRMKIQQVFFDAQAGWFFDVRLSRERVHVYGPEGWIPLWTGVATPAEAEQVAKSVMEPERFNTQLPFPTVARDNPKFEPEKGYWRGPVWIDQAVFGVEGLDRYGLLQDAAAMRGKLLRNAAGTAPFRETYNPLTGAGENSRNFSWSAAEYFLLMHEDR